MPEPASPAARKFDALRQTFDRNYRLTRLVADYLNFRPQALTGDLVASLTAQGLSPDRAVAALLSSLFGLDPEENEEDRLFFRNYVLPSVRILDAAAYRNDPYFRAIPLCDRTRGRWEIRLETYPAYRGAVCGDITSLPGFREVVPLGFFSEDFTFPAVLEDGNEWMTLTPADLDTSRDAIASARGKVVTFGLGLGYFTYHASEKDSVTSVTVVERDPDVIALFETEILPHFRHPEKVKIVNADAFRYMEDVMPREKFDFSFADIWRDASDGLPAYCRMKRLEALSQGTEFSYWIEGHILSRLRAEVFERLYPEEYAAAHGIGTGADEAYRRVVCAISDEALRAYAKVREI